VFLLAIYDVNITNMEKLPKTIPPSPGASSAPTSPLPDGAPAPLPLAGPPRQLWRKKRDESNYFK